MTILRTPDQCFTQLPDFPFNANYLEVVDEDLGHIRVHYLDEGPSDGPVILCMHGEPTWSFLYRKMIPVFVEAGFRVIAPDLVGFGKSDKPSEREDYTYAKHVSWMSQVVERLDLSGVTLLGQDWGGLIGLRLISAMPDRFAAFSLSNTALPTGDQAMPEAFTRWRQFSQEDPEFDIGAIVNLFGHGDLTDDEIDAYRAPFPQNRYKAGARQFPVLVPARPDDPASEDNRSAWMSLMQWEKPVLLCYSDADPIMAGAEQPFLKLVPGTKDQPHITLHGRHFIQEEDGPRWAQAVTDWLKTG